MDIAAADEETAPQAVAPLSGLTALQWALRPLAHARPGRPHRPRLCRPAPPTLDRGALMLAAAERPVVNGRSGTGGHHASLRGTARTETCAPRPSSAAARRSRGAPGCGATCCRGLRPAWRTRRGAAPCRARGRVRWSACGYVGYGPEGDVRSWHGRFPALVRIALATTSKR
ncbi:hypothetical protein [Streptomyces angustmyceticus]|uniref:hypothetical protein n=1 Tax=Streptomyces angustmyceticus TaxID=285578 RepID=UPI00344D2E4E